MDVHIIRGKKYYSLTSRLLDVGGRTLEVIATDITGRGPMDCIHTVKGEKETKQVGHKTLVNLFLNNKLKCITKKENHERSKQRNTNRKSG